jgi:hypothetical protein
MCSYTLLHIKPERKMFQITVLYLSYIFYASPNVIRVIKSRRMRLAGHVARMGEVTNACKILVEKPEGKRIRERLWLSVIVTFQSCLHHVVLINRGHILA